MKILRLKHRYDFGHDYYVQFFNTGKHWPGLLKNRSLLQFSVSWSDEPSWPYLQIVSGGNSPFGFLFWVHKFGFDLDIMGITWNFYRLEEVDAMVSEKDEAISRQV